MDGLKTLGTLLKNYGEMEWWSDIASLRIKENGNKVWSHIKLKLPILPTASSQARFCHSTNPPIH